MSTTLTIQNLDEELEQKLRLQAASHQRTLEAEAREILRKSLETSTSEDNSPEAKQALRLARISKLLGVWKDRFDGKSTDELMRELRGDE